MKRIWLGMAMLAGMAGSALAQAQIETVSTPPQIKDDLLAGTERFAQGADDVTEVNMDAKSLGLLTGNNAKGDLARKLDFLVVHTYSYNKPGMYSMADLQVFRQRLTDGSWSCLVHEQTKTESTDICTRKGADNETNETVLITAEPKELTFIHMKGRASLSDLSKLGSLMGPGTPAPPTPPLTKR